MAWHVTRLVFSLVFVVTVYRQLGFLTGAGRLVRLLLSLIIVTTAVGGITGYRTGLIVPGQGTIATLLLFSAVLLGGLVVFCLMVWALDILSFGTRRIGRWVRFTASPVNPSRRDFLKRLPVQGAALVATTHAATGYAIAAARPRVTNLSVPIDGLPDALNGLTIVQISDMHAGPNIGPDQVRAAVEEANALSPDIVALTGDLADGFPEEMGHFLGPFKDFKATLGVFAVTGNHEYYWGADRWIRQWKEFGIQPLLNENVILEKNGAKILVGGVTDPAASQFSRAPASDFAAAAATEEKNIAFRLLLAHRPGDGVAAERAGFNLQVSGHTHAGQFFPFNYVVKLVHRYHKGMYQHGKLSLYVNSGTGYWGPPNRLGVPPEVTCLRICPSEASPPLPRSDAGS